MSNIVALILASRKKAPEAIPVPLNVTATAGQNQVRVSFSPVTGAERHEIFFGTSLDDLNITSTTESTFLFTGLFNATTYYAYVRAVIGQRVSANSAYVSATTFEALPEPPPPPPGFFSVGAENIITSASELTFPTNTSASYALFNDAEFTLVNTKRTQTNKTTIWNRITARTDFFAKAMVAKVTSNVTLGQQALADAYKSLDGVEYTSYTKVKDCFDHYQAAIYAFDAAKFAFPVTGKISFTDRDGTTKSFDALDFANRAFATAQLVPFLNTLTWADSNTSHLAGHEATGWLQGMKIVCIFKNWKPTNYTNYMNTEFGTGAEEDGKGKLAQDLFVRTGLHYQGTYGTTKSAHLFLTEMMMRNLMPAGKTYYPPQLRQMGYYLPYFFKKDGHLIPVGEANANWTSGAPELRIPVAVAAVAFKDKYLFTKRTDMGTISGSGASQATYIPTLEDMALILHDEITETANLSEMPKVYQTGFPLAMNIVKNEVGIKTDSHDDTTTNFYMGGVCAGLHVKAGDVANLEMQAFNGEKLTGKTGILENSDWYKPHVQTWLGGMGNNTPRIMRTQDNWTYGKKGNTQIADSARFGNYAGPRRPNDNTLTVDWHEQIFQAGNTTQQSRVISQFTDNEMNPKLTYGAIDLRLSYLGDGKTTGSLYGQRAGSISRAVATTRLADKQQLTLCIDRIAPSSLTYPVWVPWNFLTVPTVTGRRAVASTVSGAAKIAVYTLNPTNASIQVKKDFLVNGRSFATDWTFSRFKEKGEGDRIEVSPGTVQTNNLIVTALMAMPSGVNVPVIGDLILQDTGVWAMQHENHVFVFSESENFFSRCTFSVVYKGYTTYNIHVLGLLPGIYERGEVKDGENALSFVGQSGDYTIAKL